MRTPKLFAALFCVACSAVAGPASAQWVQWPPGPRDTDLETIVRAAYAAATAHARLDLNYFERDGQPEALQDALVGALIAAGYPGVAVEQSSSEPQTLTACAKDTVLRFAVTLFGDGISLVAASETRVFGYHYDPHVSPDIAVEAARPC